MCTDPHLHNIGVQNIFLHVARKKISYNPLNPIQQININICLISGDFRHLKVLSELNCWTASNIYIYLLMHFMRTCRSSSEKGSYLTSKIKESFVFIFNYLIKMVENLCKQWNAYHISDFYSLPELNKKTEFENTILRIFKKITLLRSPPSFRKKLTQKSFSIF